MAFTRAQELLLEGLRRGMRLEARFTKCGKRLGDFLLVSKGGRVLRVVPRLTVAAITRTSTSHKPKAPERIFAPTSQRVPIHKPNAPPNEHAEMLDDIARGMAGKAFAKLAPADQAAVRGIAERIAAVGKVGR